MDSYILSEEATQSKCFSLLWRLVLFSRTLFRRGLMSRDVNKKSQKLYPLQTMKDSPPNVSFTLTHLCLNIFNKLSYHVPLYSCFYHWNFQMLLQTVYTLTRRRILGLHCLPMSLFWDARSSWVKSTEWSYTFNLICSQFFIWTTERFCIFIIDMCSVP